jgi:hypothetical protein
VDSKQVQQIEATAKHVHNALATMLVSLGTLKTEFDILSPEKKLSLQQQWQTAHMEAVQNLCDSLAVEGNLANG